MDPLDLCRIPCCSICSLNTSLEACKRRQTNRPHTPTHHGASWAERRALNPETSKLNSQHLCEDLLNSAPAYAPVTGAMGGGLQAFLRVAVGGLAVEV